MRYAFPDDARALSCALRRSTARASGAARLLAEVDGELWAALSLRDGAVVADPFRHTTALVELLRRATLSCGPAVTTARPSPQARRGAVPALRRHSALMRPEARRRSVRRAHRYAQESCYAEVRARRRLPPDRRSAARRSSRWREGIEAGERCDDAARRDRHRQDDDDGGDDRGGAEAGARDRPQQDARRAAVQRVPDLLPAQRGRVLRLLLRLLPARGLRPEQGPLHREGLGDQPGDRPAAPLRDGRAVRAA